MDIVTLGAALSGSKKYTDQVGQPLEKLISYQYTETDGYLSASGRINSQSSTALEVCSEIIPVKNGDIIEFELEYSETKSMWIVYGTYNSDKQFIQRIEWFPSFNNTYFKKQIVVNGFNYIRISYRTYGIAIKHNLKIINNLSDYFLKSDAKDTLEAIRKSSIGLNNPLLIPNKVKFSMHRGMSHSAPENTIPAFELAGKAGAWSIETDIWETTDGKFVCFHDRDVSGMTDGTGDISTMTYVQVQALTIDAGYNISEYPNLKIPTLAEYLTICKMYGCIPNIEVKVVSHFANLLAEIEKFGMSKSVIYTTNSLWTINQMRSVGCTNLITYVRDSGADILGLLETFKTMENTSLNLQIPDENLTKDKVDAYHEANLPVAVWTSDSEDLAKSLASIGVDIIASNEIAKFN